MCVCVWYLGEAEVEVPLQGAPLRGDDLVEDGGQQQGQDHPQTHQEETRQVLLDEVAVMTPLRPRELLPQQQRRLDPQGSVSCSFLTPNSRSVAPPTRVMTPPTCVMTPPTATAVEAGERSHCRGLD